MNLKKPLILILILITVAVAGYGLSHTFNKFNRAKNSEGLKPTVVIYTYSSFLDSFGPGPLIKAAFEKECLCHVEFVDVGSGALLIERLKLAPEAQVDLVIGLDQLNLKRAVESVNWKVMKPEPRDWVDVAKASTYPMFIPLDWSPMTFLYRDGEVKESNSIDKWLSGLSPKSLALQDPAMSSPGLAFLYWLYALSLDNPSVKLEERLSKLEPFIHSVSPEWSGSYSFFQSGAAKTVFTYLTSLVYHRVEKKETNFRAASFTEGHPVQIEYVGIPEQCRSCGLAEAFINILVSPEIQKVIMEKNYMLPVVKGVVDGTPFADLPQLKLIPTADMDKFSDGQRSLLQAWKTSIQ